MSFPPVLDRPLRALLVLAGLFASAVLPATAAEPDARGTQFFEKRIRPVLVKHCYECHSAKSKELGGGLRVDFRDGLREGGESGPAVVPKNAKRSLLLDAITYKNFEMPPDGKLPDAVIADFRRWINMGAPDPRKADTAKAKVNKTPEKAKEPLWSLSPVSKPQPPSVKNSQWCRGDLDHFVLARLEAQQLRPVSDAPPLALLRRVFFDLTGLPPTPGDVMDFEADPSPRAFAAVVDRLLASPAFGERWARHWLDVARYAESNGRDRDVLMPHAWRYRDYVIDAINADVPYNRFVIEQIAGDLLPADAPAERDHLRIATGFLAVGSKSLTGGGLQMDLVDDQIDVIGKAVLGLTVSCARCHDHKFDPIPTKDYYALAGIFRSTETLFGGGLRRPKDTLGKTNVLLVLGEDGNDAVAKFRQHQQSLAQVRKQQQAKARRLKQLQKKLPKNWQQQLKRYNAALAKAKTDAARKQAASEANARVAEFAAAQEELRQLQAKLKQLQGQQAPRLDFAVGVREAKKIEDCRVHIRGERNQLGDAVPRGFLSSIELVSTAVDRKQSGRLQLAHWLTRPENPLTARVAVNRIWLHLFGRGIVETVDNFGINGSRPTHPKLLDHLASRLVEEGWSMKRLIREIVLSRTYQLSSRYDKTAAATDPGNTLYWRMSRRRLEAEALRDAMLAASGHLKSDRPVASAVARIGDGEVGRGINTAPLSEPFPHRSVYLPILRTRLPTMLKTFDFPEPSNPQGLRSATNVPAQSLFLMNNPFVIEQAEGIAKRVIAAESNTEDRIHLAYRLCFGRPATKDEVIRAAEFLGRVTDGRQAARWATFGHALLASAEFRYLD